MHNTLPDFPGRHTGMGAVVRSSRQSENF